MWLKLHIFHFRVAGSWWIDSFTSPGLCSGSLTWPSTCSGTSTTPSGPTRRTTCQLLNATLLWNAPLLLNLLPLDLRDVIDRQGSLCVIAFSCSIFSSSLMWLWDELWFIVGMFHLSQCAHHRHCRPGGTGDRLGVLWRRLLCCQHGNPNLQICKKTWMGLHSFIQNLGKKLVLKALSDTLKCWDTLACRSWEMPNI